MHRRNLSAVIFLGCLMPGLAPPGAQTPPFSSCFSSQLSSVESTGVCCNLSQGCTSHFRCSGPRPGVALVGTLEVLCRNSQIWARLEIDPLQVSFGQLVAEIQRRKLGEQQPGTTLQATTTRQDDHAINSPKMPFRTDREYRAFGEIRTEVEPDFPDLPDLPQVQTTRGGGSGIYTDWVKP